MIIYLFVFAFDQQSFVEFVESKGLSDTLRIYIIDMIAILAPNATTIEVNLV